MRVFDLGRSDCSVTSIVIDWDYSKFVLMPVSVDTRSLVEL